MRALLLSLMALSFQGHAASWTYQILPDSMSKEKKKIAVIVSANSLRFGSPYSGTNRVRFVVRQMPKTGSDIILQIERGQLVCSDCTVRVRFDDDEPVEFSTSRPVDHDPRLIFLEAADRFIARASTATRVRQCE